MTQTQTEILDMALVERVQQGDKRAFNLLVARYQNKVAGILSRYVHRNDIADVAQETFIKAFRSIQSFRGESAFYTWLYRIAVNSAKNHLTAQSRRPPNEDILADEAESSTVGVNLQEICNPENEMLSQELKQRVFQTIKEMQEDLKMAITLRELDGLSYEEIADVMECPVGTVRSRIFRAREIIEAEIRPLLQH